jgi:hypothetical protein
MRLVWLGLLLMSLGVTEVSGIYAPLGERGSGLLLLGTLLVAVALRDRGPRRIAENLALSAAALLLLVTVPALRLPAAVLLAGGLLGLIGSRIGRAAAWGRGAASSAMLLFLGAAVAALYSLASPDFKHLDSLAPVAASLLRAVGAEVSAQGGVVLVRSLERLVEHRVSIDHVLPLPAAVFLAGSLALLATARRWGALVGCGVLAVAYLWLRYAVLLLVESESAASGLFWSLDALAIALTPWAVIHLVAFGPLAPRGEPGTVSTPVGHTVRGVVLAAAGTFCVVFGFAFADPGSRKPGRVLFDEGHSDWERTTRPMDTQWYGEESTYNYHSMRIYLEHFYDVRITRETLDRAVLDSCDVLVLKTPTRAYSAAEIEAVEAYVRRGGGLWLIGDHTNVFGITTFLNPMAARFGFEFGYDVTYDLHSGGLSLYRTPAAFRHPTVQNLEGFLFATSCTISPSTWTQRAMLGPGLRTLPLDYSEPGFFPRSVVEHGEATFGVFLQAAAAAKGRGRVAGFSDSTCFSNFFMHIPGKPELVLGTIEWLNRTNRFEPLRPVCLGVGIFLLAFAFRASRRYGAVGFFAGMVAGVGLAAAASGAIASRSYPPPSPHTPYTSVVLEAEHSRFFLPIRQLLGGTDGEHFLSFYIWIQRVGWVPSVTNRLEEALQAAPEVLVLLRPREPFTEEETRAVQRYVEGGGSLLLLDDAVLSGSTSNGLLEPFGMQMSVAPSAPADSTDAGFMLLDRGGHAVMKVESFQPITGGTALLATADGRAAVAARQVGRGAVLVCGAAHLFSTEHMGHTSAVPTPRQLQIYELEYWLLRAVRSRDFDQPMDAIAAPMRAS